MMFTPSRTDTSVTKQRLNRLAYYGQWPAALILPLMYVIGRVWIGAGAGWTIVVGLILGPLVALLLLIPPVLTVLDPSTRAARATRDGYTGATFLLWILGFLSVVTKSDQADGAKEDSALSAWTGVPISTTDALNAVATTAFWITWAVVVGLAFRGFRNRAP